MAVTSKVGHSVANPCLLINKGLLGILPPGTYSTSGALHPLPKTTNKLLHFLALLYGELVRDRHAVQGLFSHARQLCTGGTTGN
jgi:hypothetical protein